MAMTNYPQYHNASAQTVVSSDRTFGMVFAIFWAVVSFLPVLHAGSVRFWAIGLSAGFLASALLFSSVLHPLNLLWAKFGELLHRIVSPLIMALLFSLGFTTIGVLLRVLRKDLLRLKTESEAKSYWIPRSPTGPPAETMLNQF
jgi:hypothetical protein